MEEDHKATIRFEDPEDPDLKHVETYHFATRAELTAFMTGILEHEGWYSATILEDSRKRDGEEE